MIERVPVAVLPLIGFVVILWLLARPTGPVARAMALSATWKHAMIVLVTAALVAYFANDTGAAAADPAFLFAMAGIAYPAMIVAVRRRQSDDRSVVRT